MHNSPETMKFKMGRVISLWVLCHCLLVVASVPNRNKIDIAVEGNGTTAISTHVSAAQLHVLTCAYQYAVNLQSSCAGALQTHQASRHTAMPSCLTVQVLKSTDAAHIAIRGLASGKAVQGFDKAIDHVLDPLEIDFFQEVVKLSRTQASFALLASHVAAEERTLLTSVKQVAKLMTHTADRARGIDKQAWVNALYVTRSLVGQVNRSVEAAANFTVAGIDVIQGALRNASSFFPLEQQGKVQQVLAQCEQFGHAYLSSFELLSTVLRERLQIHTTMLHTLNKVYQDVSGGYLEPLSREAIPGAFWNKATGFTTVDLHVAPDILERINYEIDRVLRPHKAARTVTTIAAGQ